MRLLAQLGIQGIAELERDHSHGGSLEPSVLLPGVSWYYGQWSLACMGRVSYA